MAITAALVKELRERTSAGMMECKKALVETNGDIDAAAELMRKAGLAKADKKASRIAAEGRVTFAISDDNQFASILEVNCETDFVSKGDIFADFAQSVVDLAVANKIDNLEALNKADLNGESVDNTRRNLITKIGENINVRRIDSIDTSGVINGYVHGGGKVGVIIAASCDDSVRDEAQELMRNLAMHAAAMKPSAISYKDLDLDFVEKETAAIRAEIENGNDELVRLGKPLKRIPDFVSRHQLTDEVLAQKEAEMRDVLKAQGKPEKIWDRIIPGQLERYIKDNTQLDQEHALLSQTFVMDDKKTVEQAIADVDASIQITHYVRYGLGEGIEKKVDNFVEEVMAQAKGR
ncbi:MAG: elongation factor Ts [Gammaproteobacteria bacterium]|nr:MAG: elongation factor Ts [Gammaproteobacteria bacterium]